MKLTSAEIIHLCEMVVLENSGHMVLEQIQGHKIWYRKTKKEEWEPDLYIYKAANDPCPTCGRIGAK